MILVQVMQPSSDGSSMKILVVAMFRFMLISSGAQLGRSGIQQLGYLLFFWLCPQSDYVCTLNDVCLIYVLCEVATVCQPFIPFLFITWDCVKMTLLATKPQCGYASKSCFDTWEIQPHRGRNNLVIRAIPDLGAPCLIESLALLSLEQKCFESQDYIYRRVGFFLLLSPFVALVRSPDVEVLTILSSNFTNFFLGSRGYLGIVPMVL